MSDMPAGVGTARRAALTPVRQQLRPAAAELRVVAARERVGAGERPVPSAVVDRMVSTVHRRFVRQLAIEAERRGVR